MCKRYTGLSEDQFNELLQTLRSVRSVIKNPKSAAVALYMYLMKMRTGFACEDIGNFFHVSKTTVQRLINKIRPILKQDFVPQYMNFVRSREELIQHNTAMSNSLMDPENLQKIMLVCDGTYIYIQKSQNYMHQKKTFSGQKKRNFIKVMNIVACDGTIIFSLAPYPAAMNDAKILQDLFENTVLFDNFVPGDILLLDRGFRDVVQLIESKGIIVKMPSLVQSSEKKGQLSTRNANRSRLITALRFIVETRNGHLKTIFKKFDTVWSAYAQVHLSDDVAICAALLNKFYRTFESNKGISEEVANRMLSKLDDENIVGNIIVNNLKTHLKKFTIFQGFDQLPIMNEDRLFWISLGGYAIKQAVSYAQMHIKQNENVFDMFICPEDICRNEFPTFWVDNCDPALFMMKIKSRFRSQNTHRTFVLIDRNTRDDENRSCDENAVLGHYCECYNGWRTLGCCSHIMTLIMFLLVTKGRDLKDPAGFLDNLFNLA